MRPLRCLCIALVGFGLACGEDLASPASTGGLIIELVPNFPASSIDAHVRHGPTSPTMTLGAGTVAKAAAPAIAAEPCVRCGTRASVALKTAAQPPLDAVQVRLSGPTNFTGDLPRAGNAFEGTVDRLLPGLYSIVVIGSGGGEVTFLGTASGIRVVAGQNTTASIAFNAFVTVLDPFPTPTYEFAAPLSFTLVPGATSYQVEVSRDAAFTNVSTGTIPDNDGWAWFVESIGQYYVRIRAGNATVAVGDAVASNVETFEVLADLVGNDRATATNLGDGTAAAGRYFNLNITSGDQDVFRLGLANGDQFAVRVFTSSLFPTSLLDPIVRIENIAGTVLAQNDDADSTTVEAAISPLTVTAPGDFFIRVAGATSQDVGHYELGVTVNGVSAATLRPVNAPVARQKRARSEQKSRP